MKYEVEKARISTDSNGDLRVSIDIEITGTTRAYGRDVPVRDRRIVRHDRIRQQMNPAIVQAFWEEAQAAAFREMNPTRRFDDEV